MKVIDDKYIRMRMPLLFTLTMWLLFDRYSPPGWCYGVMGVIIVILWAAWVYSFFICEMKDPVWRDDALARDIVDELKEIQRRESENN